MSIPISTCSSTSICEAAHARSHTPSELIFVLFALVLPLRGTAQPSAVPGRIPGLDLLFEATLTPYTLPTRAYAQVSAHSQRRTPLVYEDPVFEWRDNRDLDAPRASPNAYVGIQIGSTRVMIAYGSPFVKGRKIFGGLVPYDEVWRTGADEATTVTFTGDVLVEGEPVQAGTYALFTIPGADDWTVILSSDNNQWGAYNYDPPEDVLRFRVPVQKVPFTERFTVVFDDVDPAAFSTSVSLRWEMTGISFKVVEP